MKKHLLLLSLFTYNSLLSVAQNIVTKDTTYNGLVKTIEVRTDDKEALQQIVFLNAPHPIYTQFDILEGSTRHLSYTFYYCNKDWSFSELEPLETLNGFEEYDITNFHTSQQTLIPYVHYEFYISNPKNLFRLTGNYLLVVYDRDNNNALLFSRRLYVTDFSFRVTNKFIPTYDPLRFRETQNMEITINSVNRPIRNPEDEIKLLIFQNNNPNKFITLNKPNIHQGKELIYNRADEILFYAMKEFRHKDISSVIRENIDIKYWDEKNGNYHAWLKVDPDRSQKPYYSDLDRNGGFEIFNRDVHNVDLQGEYVMAHFALEKKYPLSTPVYFYGKITDWELKEEYKMEWDPSRSAYTGAFLLKNGYYNYMFATTDDNEQPETSSCEGDWYETENDYTVLVYYRPLGGRYDELVFAFAFNPVK